MEFNALTINFRKGIDFITCLGKDTMSTKQIIFIVIYLEPVRRLNIF